MLRCCRAAHPMRLTPFAMHIATATHIRHYRTPTTEEASAATTAMPSPAADAAPQTYFDYLDRVWNSKWIGTVDENTVGAAATAATSDPSRFAQVFTACQDACGLEAGALLVLVGATTRLCTLVLSLYGERAGERMRLALPELKGPQDAFNRVYYNDTASAMEVQVAASVLKSHRRAVFAKHGTSNPKCLASLAMAPVIMTTLYHVSALCENPALDVGSSSFLWCSALALPDPFMILPVVTCAVTLLNYELSLSKELKTGWMRNIIWGARLGCLCVIPVVASFRSGVCLFFVGMNIVGLMQPLLVRSAAFRRWFGFPSKEELDAAAPAPAGKPKATAAGGAKKTPASKWSVTDGAASLRERVVAAVDAPASRVSSPEKPIEDVLQASLTVQFPYLSHLLNPQVEENAGLFAKAHDKQSKPDFSRRGPVSTPTAAVSPHLAQTGSRYARGANPLMRETPLHRGDAAAEMTSATASTHAVSAAENHSSSSSSSSGAHRVSSTVPPKTARRTPKNKGSSFASSGWKTTQLSFNENDFIPNYDADAAPHAPSPLQRK